MILFERRGGTLHRVRYLGVRILDITQALKNNYRVFFTKPGARRPHVGFPRIRAALIGSMSSGVLPGRYLFSWCVRK